MFHLHRHLPYWLQQQRQQIINVIKISAAQMNTYFYSARKLSRSFCDRLDSENIYVSQSFCRKFAWSEIEKNKGSHSFIVMTVRQHCNLKMLPIKWEWTFFDLTPSKHFWLLYFTDILWHATCIFWHASQSQQLHISCRFYSIQAYMLYPMPCCLLLPYLAVKKDVLCLHIEQALNLSFT